jgi:hypothetical protein
MSRKRGLAPLGSSCGPPCAPAPCAARQTRFGPRGHSRRHQTTPAQHAWELAARLPPRAGTDRAQRGAGSLELFGLCEEHVLALPRPRTCAGAGVGAARSGAEAASGGSKQAWRTCVCARARVQRRACVQRAARGGGRGTVKKSLTTTGSYLRSVSFSGTFLGFLRVT